MRTLPDIRITTSIQNLVARVQVRGELDLQTPAALAPHIDQLDPRQQVLLDLSGMEFMDGAGLRGLVAVVCGEQCDRAMAVLPDYQPQVMRLSAPADEPRSPDRRRWACCPSPTGLRPWPQSPWRRGPGFRIEIGEHHRRRP